MTRPRVPTGVVGEELRLEIVDGKLCLTAWRHSFVSGRYERIASLPPVNRLTRPAPRAAARK